MKNKNFLGLAELLYPLAKEDFFKLHWSNRHLFLPANASKLQKLFKLPQLQNLEALIAERILPVRACPPEFTDESNSVLLEPKIALAGYKEGMTLVFDSMQSQDSTIAEALENIREDLGLLTGGIENNLCRARSIAYATPAGGGTRLHFDANANFIIQIQGSKTWQIAPNTSVDNPTERFVAGADEMSVALEKQCHAMLLDTLPENHIEFTLKPGCVLFLPRGYWHSTTTSEDSLSLNFTFSQPSWADVFTKSLQEHLLTFSDWRELADGLAGSDLERNQQAIRRLNSLVKKFAKDFPLLTGKQLLVDCGLIRAEE